MDLATLQYSTSIDTLTLVEPYNSTNYLNEESAYSTSSLKVKYSDSVIIDALFLQTSASKTILSSKLTTRTAECEDSIIEIPLTEDGHIIIYHLILPTNAWIESWAVANQLLNTSYLYYDLNENKIIKVIYDETVSLQRTVSYEISDFDFESFQAMSESWKSLSNPNIPEDMDILHLFITNNLRKCYVQTSYKALANNLNCKEDADLKFRRDLIHMAYTVIQYQIDLNHYDEAQLLYEEFTKCGGLCGDFTEPSKHYGCGCSKKQSH